MTPQRRQLWRQFYLAAITGSASTGKDTGNIIEDAIEIADEAVHRLDVAEGLLEPEEKTEAVAEGDEIWMRRKDVERLRQG
jgi:hypothetical protein